MLDQCEVNILKFSILRVRMPRLSNIIGWDLLVLRQLILKYYQFFNKL